MFNTALFSERLNGLMFDANLNATDLARKIGTTKVTICRYLRQERMPTLEILIKLADFFHVSLDFFIGLEPDNYTSVFNKCPPFSERFDVLLKEFQISKYKLEKEAHIDEQMIYAWLKGKNEPTIESIIKLADYFKRSVDYILGREK